MARRKRSVPIVRKFRASLTLAATILATAVALSPMPPRAGRITPTQATPRVVAEYGKLPLHFEPNVGQTDDRVRFLARGSGYGLFLTPTESVLTLRKAEGLTAVLRMKLLGANPRPKISGRDQLPGKSNYFIGNDSKRWRINIPQYARVEYEDVYPGVDLAYYGNQGQIEYDFVVNPGADPRQITLRIEGAEAVQLDGNGNLLLSLPEGEVLHRAPIIYQQVGGVRKAIDGRFVLRGPHDVGFEVGPYAADRALVMDPLLKYSTYLGGSDVEVGNGIAVDVSGSVYVTGYTGSSDFPTANPLQPAKAGTYDAFVAKLNADGSALVYSTYLGGSRSAGGAAIAVDASGNTYITGTTNSFDFPTVNPVQPASADGLDAFVAKLNAAGSALVYSTYLGGVGLEEGFGIAVDASGSAHITGHTTSSNFPTANPVQAARGGLTEDAFVTKLDPAGSAFVYSTYLGGADSDHGYGVGVDLSGNTYVTGDTVSTDFPTANPLQASSGGTRDAFVAKLNASGVPLVYSTYLGGASSDSATGLAVDASGSVYVTGTTLSTDFPTAAPLQGVNAGTYDVFVSKLNAAGSALVFSTYLGGYEVDGGRSITVDLSGSAYVVGSTNSINFPTAHPIQVTKGGEIDTFVAKLNAAGSSPVYSTYLGGSNNDEPAGIAVDASGNAYLTGITFSSDFPASSAFQATLRGSYDAFVAKIGPGTPPPNDFNADGKVDILWRDQASSGRIAVWFMNGATMTHARLTNPEGFPLLNWQIVGTGDFDDDDRTDILWRDQASSGQIAVWFMDGTRMKSGTLTNPGSFPLLNWRIVGTGDFNTDGKPDILWRDQASTGRIAVWFMDGTTMTSATLTDPGAFPLLNWEIVGTGDFNGDGKTDILWRDTKSTGRIAVWFMDGITMTSATLTDTPPFPLLNWEIQAVGDYDGDGKPDLVWRDQTGTGRIALWFMDGITLKSATLTNPEALANLNWRIVGPK